MCPKDTQLTDSGCGTLADNKTGASEPVNRGIGVSVAVVERIVIARLRAWDVNAHAAVDLEPGARIADYRIERHSQAEIDGGAEPYIVRFMCNGREISCALVLFQARTQPPTPAAAGT